MKVREMLERFEIIRVSDTEGNWMFSDDENVRIYFNLDSESWELYKLPTETEVNLRILEGDYKK